jgi:hypothetical protein
MIDYGMTNLFNILFTLITQKHAKHKKQNQRVDLPIEKRICRNGELRQICTLYCGLLNIYVGHYKGALLMEGLHGRDRMKVGRPICLIFYSR